MSADKHTAQTEIRQIPGASGYGVDRNGGTWCQRAKWGSRGLTGIWRPVKPKFGNTKYLSISMTLDGRKNGKRQRATRHVHTLMLTAFVGPRPANFECRHLDGNPTNNRLENLAWGTRSENQCDAVRHGTHVTIRRPGITHPCHKLTEAQVRMVPKLQAKGLFQWQIAERLGVSQTAVSKILRGYRWKHLSRKLVRDSSGVLSPDSVREIRRLRREGVMLQVLADRFGRNIGTIFKIVHGLTWKDVSDE